MVLALAACGLACGPAGPASDRGADRGKNEAATPKSLVIGMLSDIRGFGAWEIRGTSGGAAALGELHTSGLVTAGMRGGSEPRLAAWLPSLGDGSILVLPDGRMRVTWHLRRDVTWHDGAPFTADDLVFSVELARHPEILSSASPFVQGIEAMEATDPWTLVMTWESVTKDALTLGWYELWPYPKHLLGEAFGRDKQAFRGHPYFTTEYVNLGPFRLVDFRVGEEMVFQRHDGYFLGPAKLDTVTVRTIGSGSTLVAHFKAGALDMVAEKTIGGDLALPLREEWRRTGHGTVHVRPDNWLYAQVQLDPRWARPVELGQDIRIRRGLLSAIDRDIIREVALPGIPDTSGDTFMDMYDPRAEVVGQPFARYPYDPARATQELANAGWRRGSDGRMVGRDGQPVQLEARAAVETWSQETAMIADFWRQLGIEVSEVVPTEALSRDFEWHATFPAIAVRARSVGEDALLSFDSRRQALRETRWIGTNYGHYVNPTLDRLLDQVKGTLAEGEQARIIKEMAEIVATDLPALPVYFRPNFALVSKGVHALTNDYGGSRSRGMSRNAHRWAKD
jgi:peptide/nickel transport system substrate-binding protein